MLLAIDLAIVGSQSITLPIRDWNWGNSHYVTQGKSQSITLPIRDWNCNPYTTKDAGGLNQSHSLLGIETEYCRETIPNEKGLNQSHSLLGIETGGCVFTGFQWDPRLNQSHSLLGIETRFAISGNCQAKVSINHTPY